MAEASRKTQCRLYLIRVYIISDDPVGLGPIWEWSDGTNNTDFEVWDSGYPAQEFSGKPQCGVLVRSGFWQNMDCSPDSQVYDVNFICKAPKGKLLS